MRYFELSPAYGRDYRSVREVKQAWEDGKDFQGDFQLGFKQVNKNDVPRPSTVMLRYARNTKVTSVKVQG